MDNYDYYVSCIEEVLRSNPEGLTISDISQILSMSRNTIGKYLELMSLSGVVDIRMSGKAKIFYLAPRVPFANIFHYLPDPIFQTNDLWIVIDVNLNGLGLLNIDEEDLIGRNLLDILSIHGLTSEIREKIIKSDRVPIFTSEISLIHKGTSVNHFMTVADLSMHDGEMGHLFIFENISELKAAEEGKQHFHFLFSTLAEESYEQVCIFSPEYMLTYANGRYITAHGQETFRLKGSIFLDSFEKESRLLIRDACQAVMKNDSPHRIIFQVNSLSSPQWYDLRLFPIPHLTESADRILAIIREITGFQEGGSSTSILSTLLRTITEGVLTTSPGGTILSWNPGAEKITGYPAEELLGGTAQMIIPPELNGGQDVIIDAIKGIIVTDIKMTIRAKGGRKKKVLLSSAVIQDHTGEISQVMLVWHEP